MPSPRTLSELFVPAASHEARAAIAAEADGEAALVAYVAAARSAWPDLIVPDASFVPYAASRISSLDHARAGDLYVGCACALGVPGAIAALEKRYFGDIDAALGAMRLGGSADDVKQTLREHLLVGSAAQPAKITEYAGRGDLRGWLRVSAVRAALKMVRKDKPKSEVDDDALLEVASADVDPELGYLKAVYRSAFREAFQDALDGLEDREKNLLRQHVVDGVSIDAIGAIYSVHRATAARWVARAKEHLLTATRARFIQRARISKDECDSVLRMVQSQLDVTIRRRLEKPQAR